MKTKREVAEAQDQADAELLAMSLPREPFWGLPETLLWIGLRDMTQVVEPLPAWRRSTDEWNAGQIVGVVQEYIKQTIKAGGDVEEPEPVAALYESLRQGAVEAFGSERGSGPFSPIPLAHWSDLVFGPGPKQFDGQTCAFAPALRSEIGHFWARVHFVSDSLLRKFPTPGAVSSPPDPPGGGAPKRKAPPPSASVDFKLWADELFSARRAGPTGKEAAIWAANKGFSRQWVRDQLTRYPVARRLKRGNKLTR